MKKILFVCLVITVCLALISCGNMSIGPGRYTFKKVHVDLHSYSGCLTVENWHDSETGIEVKTTEAGSLFLSEGTYVLLDGTKDCPFCNHE